MSDEKLYHCTKCGDDKPRSAFHNNKGATHRDGAYHWCKACEKANRQANPDIARAASAAWKKANPDKVKARSAAWYQANADKMKTKSAAYRQANADRVKARQAAWNTANAARAKATQTAWRKANPERNRGNRIAAQRRYDARKAGLPGGHFTAAEFTARCEEQEWRCAYCGRDLTSQTTTADHWFPISRPETGAINEISNILAACFSCNSGKCAKTGDEFLAVLCRDLIAA